VEVTTVEVTTVGVTTAEVTAVGVTTAEEVTAVGRQPLDITAEEWHTEAGKGFSVLVPSPRSTTRDVGREIRDCSFT